jgi:hypothetical protein
MSDNLDGDLEDIPGLMESMSMAMHPEGLTPASRNNKNNSKNKHNSRFGTRKIGSASGERGGGGGVRSDTAETRTLTTASNLNVRLMQHEQSPPRPSYGSYPQIAEQKYRLMEVSMKRGGRQQQQQQQQHTLGATTGSGSGSKNNNYNSTVMPAAQSLATLGTTQIPPTRRSSAASLHAGRGDGLAENMSYEKQRNIANELEKRLLKTQWIFPPS